VIEPVRLQRARRRGFDLQAHSRAVNGLPAVIVDRSTKAGNPWRITHDRLNGWCVLDPDWLAHTRRHFCSSERVARRYAVLRFRRWARSELSPLRLVIKNLHGCNLAGWCRLCPAHAAGKPLDVQCGACAPCHVDVLGELANPPVCEAVDS